MIPIIIGLAIGVGVPLQTSINSRLREAVGSPFLSSFLSFLMGTLFLAVITLASGATLGIHPSFIANEPGGCGLAACLGWSI
nr:DMT family transporter [Lacticaseibacillus thailandensis]